MTRVKRQTRLFPRSLDIKRNWSKVMKFTVVVEVEIANRKRKVVK